MPLRDFLKNYNYNSEEFDFEAFKADVEKEYGSDEGVWTTKVNDLEEGNKKTAEELRQTKVHNYDLLRQVPGDDSKTQKTPIEENEAEVTVDSFFGDKDKADK